MYTSLIFIWPSTRQLQVTNDGLYVSVASLSKGVKTTAANTKPVRTSLKASSNLEDKDWIAVDNSSNAATTGHVYVCWTHFTATSDMILFSKSTNRGSSWSAATQVSPVAQNGGVQGCQVAVGTNGEVFVAWEVFFSTGQVQIWIAKSTNGGTSFATPVPATGLFNPLNFAATYRDNSFPALAVNPASDFVYILYADQPGANSRVEFIRSTVAGGTTFTSPVAINDKSTGQRLMPAISVDSLGTLAASWFDTRNSPTNSSNFDIFATRSLNNGGTFAPNARVPRTTVVTGGAAFIGDYSGIAAAGGEAHPVWNSGGFGGTANGQLQTADLQ